MADSVDLSQAVLHRMIEPELALPCVGPHETISHRIGSQLYRTVFEEARAREATARFRGFVVFEATRWQYVVGNARDFFLTRLPEALAQGISERIISLNSNAELLIIHFAGSRYSVGVVRAGSPFQWIACGCESVSAA